MVDKLPAAPRKADVLTVPRLLAARAAAEPDRLALRLDGGASLTFGDWHRRSERLAGGLAKAGVRPGDRVGLIFGNARWPEYAVAYTAAQRAGAAAVPVPHNATVAESDEILASCGASVALTGVPRPGEAATPHLSFDDLDQGDAAPPDIDPRPGDLAQILFTSGTSGRPKGVAASNANLVFGHRLSPRHRLFDHSEWFIHAFPIGTTAGQMVLFHSLTASPPGLAMERFDAERFCAAIEEFSVGTVFLVPAMAIDLINSGAAERHDLSRVVMVASSGAALPQKVALSLTGTFPGATVLNAYSSTEAMPAQLLLMVDPEEPESAGFPVGNTGIRIAGEDGEPLPPGETGDVWLRCPAPSRSYYGAPEENAAVFRDGWVRMGDVGYLDEEDRLFLVDRESDVVKSGGLKVSTSEVEAVLYGHPGVREAAVFGVPHEVMGTMVAAAVVLADDGSLPDVRSYLRERLARHKVPLRWLAVDALPRNDVGKVVKAELRERLTPRGAGVSGDA